MDFDAAEQYQKALKAGQKYVKSALSAGTDPYPAVLDELEKGYEIKGRVDLGLQQIPMDLIVGTVTAGRVNALAGNFMPLLEAETEFGVKWTRLCAAHMAEGIRDPILCYEFLGKFYVQEGNKRVSVLRSFESPMVAAEVTRLLPAQTEDPEIVVYYEFVRFHSITGLYDVHFDRPGSYAKLLAALGMAEDHVWTETERRSFRSGYTRFCEAYGKMKVQPALPAEALLVWLQVFPFAEIKQATMEELVRRISELWTDVKTQNEPESPIAVQPAVQEKEKSLVAKLLTKTQSDQLTVAFVYGFDPKTSSWTRAHEAGRAHIAEVFGEKLRALTYQVVNRDYAAAMEAAVEDGAKLIFATTPPMIDACRKTAALHPNVRVFNCALSQPYTGVRMYHSRIYECKFITGAIAGAMADNNRVGYIAGYPIFGEPAGINAFALGVRMTNPRARVKLTWSSTRRDAIETYLENGISVISNRDAASPDQEHWALEWGTYKLSQTGTLQPLAVPCWNWGAFYEQVVRSVLKGTLEEGPADKAIHYWLGLDTGAIDVRLSEALPDGVRSLALLLKQEITAGRVDPFRTRILDQSGTLRNDGEKTFQMEELMQMDWLCDNVDGGIPSYEELLPGSRELVRLLGLYREQLSPVVEEKQL